MRIPLRFNCAFLVIVFAKAVFRSLSKHPLQSLKRQTWVTLLTVSTPFLILFNTASASSDGFQCKSNLPFESMEILGAGGSGDVYKSPNMKSLKDTVIKLSHQNNPVVVEHECEILNYLNSRNIPNIEHCIATCDVSKTGQKYEVLFPYFASENLPVSDFMLISDETDRLTAIANFVTTNLQIIFAGVVLSDLQFLLDIESGKLSTTNYAQSPVFRETFIDRFYGSEICRC